MFDGFDWVEMSPEILGEEPGEQSGMSVAMSGDGGVVCYGAPNNNGNGTFAGTVRAYSTFGFQLGSEINGSDNFNALGTSSSGSALSLSNSGSRMAVGNRFANGSAGEVKIYQLTSDWIQMGSAIPGNGSTGNSVELNFDGNKLVVGSHTASPAGGIKTFNWDGSNWVQFGQEILGQNGGDGFGNSVSMSHNGLTIAGGIHGNDSNGNNAGLARVYTFCDATFNTITATSCSSYTVPSGDETYTVSGMYTDTIPNTQGCDSLLTIFLTISNSSSSTDFQTACDTYTWIDGVTYTSSTTTPSWILTNAAGCDSLVTLDLTINSVDTTVVILDPTTLQSALQGAEYQWLDCTNNYAPLPGETNQTIILQNDGFYALSVTMNNCTDTSSCYFITTIGLMNHSLNTFIRVSPNPSDGLFFINLGDVFENVVVDVFDTSGRLIVHNAYGAAKEVECLIQGDSGVYIATISIAGKTVIPLRLLKQ
ncbi:MAG: T9SS type A sorting domain-containing protein, partial [Flavobacteriales bacterium]|nr:T9SS type A sorting domain-containing protein [Flavobacteriales bacterium]